VSAIAIAAGLAGAAVMSSAGSASAAPRPAAVDLGTGLVIQTDSVMAAARVPYDGQPSTVSIAWGDGHITPGSNGTPGTGVLLFTHEYALPADKLTFFPRIDVRSGAETAARFAQITPRFRVDKGLDYFTPLAQCDSGFEGNTEWQLYENSWRTYLPFDWSTHPELIGARVLNFGAPNDGNPDMRPIKDSALSYEMTMTDKPIVVRWQLSEDDPIDDEEMADEAIELHPLHGTRHVYQNFHIDPDIIHVGGSQCRAAISVDIRVNLLKPRITLQGGQLPPPPPTTPTTNPPPAPTTTLPPAPTTTPPAPTTTKPPTCRPPANPENCQEN
jgi:hypothetical protein